uniref:EGF-like domain-containing protein n=1 Tax=Oryzias melastigma TaxID=30732 RepID=A0A3B3CEQ2_ORYME
MQSMRRKNMRESTKNKNMSHAEATDASPTVPPLHSEHFKPCHEKDLAYCLNGGECFVIETLSGPHKHCKCREGYQGIRCDQFLPKTDSILSDPNHLGIEFMESKAVYRRQVLLITSIAMAIGLLGVLCMALYCSNKRRREKLQAHLKESHSLKRYTTNAHSAQDSKMRAPNTSLQMHQYCPSSTSRPGNICNSGFVHCSVATAPCTSSRGPSKQNRGGSSLQNPDQKRRPSHWPSACRTPLRAKSIPPGESKYSGPTYQHLREAEGSEKEAEVQRRVQTEEENGTSDSRRGSSAQTPLSSKILSSLCGRTELPSGPRPPPERRDPAQNRSTSLPFCSCSIPVITSVQCHHQNEVSCMQTGVAPATASTPCKEAKKKKAVQARLFPASCASSEGQQQDEVALLLEEAQEQLRALALAHRKHKEGGIHGGEVEARETVCFLNLNAGGPSGPVCNGPTQIQLLSPSLPYRDLGQLGQ